MMFHRQTLIAQCFQLDLPIVGLIKFSADGMLMASLAVKMEN